jgi:RHS repeat-associated protein
MFISAASNQMNQFTSKERDAETGLDYFGARYYSGAQGRFLSVDPLIVQRENAAIPQSWNRYSYVANNPFRNVDPTGEWWIESGNASDPYKWVDDCGNVAPCWDRIAASAGDKVIIYGPGSANDKMELVVIQGRVDLRAAASGYYGFIFQSKDITATWASVDAAVRFLNIAMWNSQLGSPDLELNDYGNKSGTKFDPHAEHMPPRNGVDMKFLTKGKGTSNINKSDFDNTNRLIEIGIAQGYSDPLSGIRTEERLVNGKITRVPSEKQYPGRHDEKDNNVLHLAMLRN